MGDLCDSAEEYLIISLYGAKPGRQNYSLSPWVPSVLWGKKGMYKTTTVVWRKHDWLTWNTQLEKCSYNPNEIETGHIISWKQGKKSNKESN